MTSDATCARLCHAAGGELDQIQFLPGYVSTANGITVISFMRFPFDPRESGLLRANPRRGIGFEEAQELFSRPYWLDQRSDVPEQYRAIGWVGDRLYSVIFEVREDEDGGIPHLVTLWRSTKEEVRLYEENS